MNGNKSNSSKNNNKNDISLIHCPPVPGPSHLIVSQQICEEDIIILILTYVEMGAQEVKKSHHSHIGWKG